MLDSVSDLLRARPHQRNSVKLTVEQQRIYHEGYYTGLVYALRVMDLEISNYAAVTKTLRAERRRERIA